jgi:Raf kinase inhibitor-like YbhB/YbcL family protein
MTLTISSPAFAHNSNIPAIYTCDGRNISPPLQWTEIPPGSKSLVLIIDDPDAPDPAAPKRIWVHWVLYNIPAGVSGLTEDIAPQALPAGTLEGLNDGGTTGYGGPCPPIGCHRYFHKLYALDVVLPDLHQPTKKALLQAIEGHILAHTEIIGLYQRPAR